MLADRLLVVEDGRVVQEGTPAEVARRPATDYVARLVGLNLYAGPGRRRPVVALDGGGSWSWSPTTARTGRCSSRCVRRPSLVTTQPCRRTPARATPGRARSSG